MRVVIIVALAALLMSAAVPANASLLGDWFGVSLSVGGTGSFNNSWAPISSTADYFIDDNWSSHFGRTPHGGETFDVEAIYFDNDAAHAYIAVVTSFAVPNGVPYLGWLVHAGDLALDLGGGTLDAGVDVFQFDLKHMNAQRHRELTGADCERLQQNAAFLLERRATVQFRMPLVPGVNDDPQNLDAVAQFLVGHGVHALRLVPYHRMYFEKYAKLGLRHKDDESRDKALTKILAAAGRAEKITNGVLGIARNRGHEKTPTDLAKLIDSLDLNGIALVGHSTGGEVARYLGRHGTGHVTKAVLMGSVTPLMRKTDANPGGRPMEKFDDIRAGVAADRSQFFKDLTTKFYGANRPGAKLSQGVRDAFWLQGLQSGLKNQLDCIKAFSESDFTEDLKQFDVPTLIIHGDDDQIVPVDTTARASSKLVKHATLKVYPGGPHRLADTHKDEFNADLLAFIRA